MQPSSARQLPQRLHSGFTRYTPVRGIKQNWRLFRRSRPSRPFSLACMLPYCRSGDYQLHSGTPQNQRCKIPHADPLFGRRHLLLLGHDAGLAVAFLGHRGASVVALGDQLKEHVRLHRFEGDVDFDQQRPGREIDSQEPCKTVLCMGSPQVVYQVVSGEEIGCDAQVDGFQGQRQGQLSLTLPRRTQKNHVRTVDEDPERGEIAKLPIVHTGLCREVRSDEPDGCAPSGSTLTSDKLPARLWRITVKASRFSRAPTSRHRSSTVVAWVSPFGAADVPVQAPASPFTPAKASYWDRSCRSTSSGCGRVRTARRPRRLVRLIP